LHAAASPLSRRVVATAVIWNCGSAWSAGTCAPMAQPRSGLVPIKPTRIVSFFMVQPRNEDEGLAHTAFRKSLRAYARYALSIEPKRGNRFWEKSDASAKS
jgi:hypothetical protein